MRTLIIFLLGLTIFSCNQTQTTENKIMNDGTFAQTTKKNGSIDEITELFEKAILADTFEYINQL